MRYRVDDLAARCDVSVDTIRYYQAKGLLPRPVREGRLAWYDDAHVERLGRIRQLQGQGFSLAMIARLLAGELDASEQALALALVGPLPGDEAAASASLTADEVAERTGVPAALLEALAREGLLEPHGEPGAPRYTTGDVEVVHAGLALLEAGVPLSELLDLARRHDQAMRATADHAVDLFARFVRDPIRGATDDEGEAAERAVEALHRMLPATSTLVAHHFRRLLLDAARSRLEDPAMLDDRAAAAIWDAHESGEQPAEGPGR